MEALSTMTKGTKGLYHANIDPATDYAMTEKQWFRAVEVLEDELNLTGQPRAIVKHKKDGREHIHVVWQRTDTELWKLKSDILNYPAHERASRTLEKEFGHDVVRGAFTNIKKDQPRPVVNAGVKVRLNAAAWNSGIEVTEARRQASVVTMIL